LNFGGIEVSGCWIELSSGGIDWAPTELKTGLCFYFILCSDLLHFGSDLHFFLLFSSGVLFFPWNINQNTVVVPRTCAILTLKNTKIKLKEYFFKTKPQLKSNILSIYQIPPSLIFACPQASLKLRFWSDLSAQFLSKQDLIQ
jgi:hypothetical protein